MYFSIRGHLHRFFIYKFKYCSPISVPHAKTVSTMVSLPTTTMISILPPLNTLPKGTKMCIIEIFTFDI